MFHRILPITTESYFILGSVSSSNNRIVSSRVSYKKFQLIRVIPFDEDDVLEIEGVSEEPGVQVWMPIRKNKTADLLLPPSIARDVKRFLTQKEIEFVVLSTDLEVSVYYIFQFICYINLRQIKGVSILFGIIYILTSCLMVFFFFNKSIFHLISFL